MRKELWNYEIELDDASNRFSLKAETLVPKSWMIRLSEEVMKKVAWLKGIKLNDEELEKSRNIFELVREDANFKKEWIRQLEKYGILNGLVDKVAKSINAYLYDYTIDDLDFEDNGNLIKVKVVISGNFWQN
jgi:hypothetical protein